METRYFKMFTFETYLRNRRGSKMITSPRELRQRTVDTGLGNLLQICNEISVLKNRNDFTSSAKIITYVGATCHTDSL